MYNILLMNNVIQELNRYDNNTPFFSLENELHLAKVVDVYDGDTVYVVFKYGGSYHKFKVRMLGYNAPEMKPGRDVKGREEIVKKAVVAKNRLIELILNKTVYLICEKFDDFGRILGTINLDDVCINDLMLAEGHGTPYK